MSEEDKWQCPVCGYNEYGIKYGVDSFANCEYYCKQCTVKFIDPKRFNALNRHQWVEQGNWYTCTKCGVAAGAPEQKETCPK